jgi:hypothetical protein
MTYQDGGLEPCQPEKNHSEYEADTQEVSQGCGCRRRVGHAAELARLRTVLAHSQGYAHGDHLARATPARTGPRLAACAARGRVGLPLATGS